MYNVQCTIKEIATRFDYNMRLSTASGPPLCVCREVRYRLANNKFFEKKLN